MIDVENVVFSSIATNLRNEYLPAYPKMKVYGEYVEFPEGFPCVSLWMTDNYTYRRSQDESRRENHANVMFTTEIYTTGPTKKAIAKKLANSVDVMLQDMGLTRSAFLVLPNVDRNAFRITMRHIGVVGQPFISTVDGEEVQTFHFYRQ